MVEDLTKTNMYELARRIGGIVWQVEGVKPAGRAKHRPDRQAVIHELDGFIRRSLLRIDQDTAGAAVEAANGMVVATYATATGENNTAIAIIEAARINALSRGANPEAIDRALQESLERLAPLPDQPHAVATNRMPDTEFCYQKADILAIHIRLSGAMRHGQPYNEDFEDAFKDFVDSLTMSIGSNTSAGGRFQTRRADYHRDTLLDLVALRAVDRGLSLRESMDSVASSNYGHTYNIYQQWENTVRGMEDERNALHRKYSSQLQLPKGRAWEVISKLYEAERYKDPDPTGPGWEGHRNNLRKTWEDKTIPMSSAIRGIVTHGGGGGYAAKALPPAGRPALPGASRGSHASAPASGEDAERAAWAQILAEDTGKGRGPTDGGKPGGGRSRG